MAVPDLSASALQNVARFDDRLPFYVSLLLVRIAQSRTKDAILTVV